MKEDNRPLMVSIRCITYNHELYIRQCLEGFVMQKTTFRFEAVVHDDASTDGTASIIKEYAEKYPNLIKPIFETENQWSKHDNSLRKIMDDACKGKYIAICEGDDYWTDPLKLQKQVDFLESNSNCSLICNRTERYSESHNCFVSDNVCYEQSQYVNPTDIIEKGGLFISTCSVVYRSSVKENYPDYCFNCHVGDYPLAIMSAMKGDVYYLNERMSVYRIENYTSWVGRQKGNYLSDLRLDGIVSEIRMLQGFQHDFPQYTSSFYKRIEMTVIGNMPSRHIDKAGSFKFYNTIRDLIPTFSKKSRLVAKIKNSRLSFFFSLYNKTR